MGDPLVRIESAQLAPVIAALKTYEDGRLIRNGMARAMRQELKPAVAETRQAIKSMPATMSAQPALRASIARKVGYSVKLIGRDARATVRARKTPLVRRFTNAPKRTQQETWRAHTWGGGWRDQRGKKGWFDATLNARREEYKAALERVIAEVAIFIAMRG
jgi:hypothetical protein